MDFSFYQILIGKWVVKVTVAIVSRVHFITPITTVASLWWLSLWHIISFLLIIYPHGCKFEFGYKHVKSWGLSFVIGLTGIKALLCNTHLRYYCQCPSLSSLLRGRYGSKAKTWVVLCWVFVRILLSNPTPVVTSYPFLNLEKSAVET